MKTLSQQHLAAVILIVLSVALWFYDDWMSWTGQGEETRLSMLVLWVTLHAPVTFVIFVFWAGIVVGHLFLPPLPMTADKS